MPESVSFVILQTPKGKARHQTVVTLRCGTCQRVIKGQRDACPHCQGKNLTFLFSNEYSPAEQKEYERFAALCAQQGMQGREKFTGPTRVECRFWFGIPKSREKKLKDGDWHTQRCDVDNALKSVLDACNNLVWTDDCIITQITAEKRWTTGAPRTEVLISSL